jgi:putative pyruvate formate lyase activating enzyme
MKRYFSVLDGKKKPKFIIANKKGLLGRKVGEAEEIMKRCEFCERKCKVNRLSGEKGFCGVGNKWHVFGAHMHFGEEPELVPSGTLFLAGCTLRCCYCQNAPDSIQPELGTVWTEGEIKDWIEQNSGRVKNINFVTPDCYVYNILRVLNLAKADIPIVWNSSGYYSEKTAELIKEVVDVYLLDFRYFNEECSKKLSDAPNYPEVVMRNLSIASKDAEVLIRVLVLPGHIECCSKPILKWISENIPDVRVNIMDQYSPRYLAHEYEEINKRVSDKEMKEVTDYARELGLKHDKN